MFDLFNSATIAAARRRGERLRNRGGEGRICPPAPPRDLSRACAGLLAVAEIPRAYGPKTLESVWLDLALCGVMLSFFISTIWIIASREISGENQREREKTSQAKGGKENERI